MRYTTNPVGNVLCVRSLETGEEREFRPDINSFGWPRWSPDGRSVMVVGWNEKGHMGLFQINTQTGNVMPLLPSDGRILYGGHDWSLDGKTIYYGCLDSNTKKYQICVRNLESGEEKVLYESDERFDISLSPDDQWLALLFSYNEKQSLNIIPSTGGELRELYRFKKEDGIVFGRNCEITWTSDGKYILYTMVDSKLDDPGWELCRISAETWIENG
jgi:Tol biopolymer transport system component